jgi:hypothetical protein
LTYLDSAPSKSGALERTRIGHRGEKITSLLAGGILQAIFEVVKTSGLAETMMLVRGVSRIAQRLHLINYSMEGFKINLSESGSCDCGSGNETIEDKFFCSLFNLDETNLTFVWRIL